MKPENHNPLTRRTRQVCILCEATDKIVNHIHYALLDRAILDGVRIHIDGGEMFEIYRTLRNGTKVMYYQWADGAYSRLHNNQEQEHPCTERVRKPLYSSGTRVDVNGLLQEVGRQAYFTGLPFNERWGKESFGYWIGYKEAQKFVSLRSFN